MSSIRVSQYERSCHGDAPWRLVAAVFDEYGFPFAENDYDADLHDPGSWYAAHGGGFAVAEDAAGEVVGCAGCSDEGGGRFELHRLYVAANARRAGAGGALVAWVVAESRRRGAHEVVLYSDIHFADAHRLYERFGFRCVRFRYAPDPWQSREWGFVLDLRAKET